jgi:hypothetical protein
VACLPNPVVATLSFDFPVISLIRDQTAKSFPAFQEEFPASSNIFALRQVREFAQQRIDSERAPDRRLGCKTDGWKNSLF